MKTAGTPIVGLLGLLFVALKLLGKISWSWWWVTAPFWVPAAILLIAALVCVAILLLGQKPSRR